MPQPPLVRNTLLDTLLANGPMSASALAEHLGWENYRVIGALSGARRAHPGRFFRIVRYVSQVDRSGREAAIYAAERGLDAPRPDFGEKHRKQRAKRYAQLHKERAARLRKARRSKPAAATPWAAFMPRS